MSLIDDPRMTWIKKLFETRCWRRWTEAEWM